MKATRSVLEPALAGPQAALMMTLSAFASIDEKPLPGEFNRDHERAILADLGQALGQAAASWSPIWVGLSADISANMVYIANNEQDTSQYAVVIRGTDFTMPLDILEDMDVRKAVPFPAAGSIVKIAQGTSKAHQLLIEAVGGNGNTLLDELVSRVGSDGESSTIFVTGHSLGGALTTTIALYLRTALPKAGFQVYTFAAPTAGLTDFANLYDTTFPGSGPGANSSWRFCNVWDVVPQAWQANTLDEVLNWYPAPGPVPTGQDRVLLKKIIRLPGDLPYQQPSVNPCQLNNPSWQDALRDEPPADFLTEVAFEHDCNTYLTLLQAPNVSVLSSVAPNAMARGANGTTLTMTGLGFTSQTKVSFSNSDITVQSIVPDGQSKLNVTVSVADKAPLGPCDVILTSGNGDPIPGGADSFLVL